MALSTADEEREPPCVASRRYGGEDDVVSEPAPAPARRRGLETVGDMVRSIAVVGVFVVILFLVVWWQRPEGARGPVDRSVDVPGVFQEAAVSAGFPLLEPTGLPDGWTPTSAWVEGELSSGVGGVVVHAGYLTPAGSYAEVKQTDGDAALAVRTWTDGAKRTGAVTIDGQQWQTWESASRKALVRRDGGTTRVVTGKADWPELTVLAGSLVPAASVPTAQPSASSSSSSSSGSSSSVSG